MKRFSILVFCLMLVALPLRGVAAVVADLCGPQHGDVAVQPSHECCDDGDTPAESDARHEGHGTTDGTCGHCAACTVGASAVSDGVASMAVAPPDGAVIPFVDRQPPSGIAERLDRPPLTL